MDDAYILRLVEVLSADVSGTMFADACRAAPQLGPLIHALGCIHAAVVAFETFRAGTDSEESEAEFVRLAELVRERAKTTAQLAIMRDLATGEVGNG